MHAQYPLGSSTHLMKITHLITGLTTGGAEAMLYKLLSAMDRSRYEPVVISLMDKGTVGPMIEALGIPVYCLDMKGGRPSIQAVRHLARLSRSLNSDLVQGWMYHGNLAALAFKFFARNRPPLLWNIRQSLYSLKEEKPLTRMVIRAGARLSQIPERIIYNSQAAAGHHESFGYCSGGRAVLRNGFDVERYQPSKSARLGLRKELGVAESAPLVGMVARYHPMKDHDNFIQAANKVYARRPDVHFVMAGREVTLDHSRLRDRVNASNGKTNFHLLGERKDIPEMMAALDLLVSSSAWGESFPNVIGEAMACAVPCVVTDVGDSAAILGGSGVKVPPTDSDALAGGVIDLLNMSERDRCSLGLRARQRIINEFSLAQVAAQYTTLYNEVTDVRPASMESS